MDISEIDMELEKKLYAVTATTFKELPMFGEKQKLTTLFVYASREDIARKKAGKLFAMMFDGYGIKEVKEQTNGD